MNKLKATEAVESFDERIEVLFGELELAIQWDRPSILLAVYASEFVRITAETALTAKLNNLGQRIIEYRVTGADNADIPAHLVEHPERHDTVFFVSGLQWGQGRDDTLTYRALNIRREYLVDERIRAVFWLTEREATVLPKLAPDFWAFRHRVVEFVESPDPDHVTPLAHDFAWRDWANETLREDTDAKISLREALLSDLPDTTETLSVRAELMYTLAGLSWAKKEYQKSIELLHGALNIAEQLSKTRLEATIYNGLGIVFDSFGRYEDAFAAYQQAIALDPKFAAARLGLGTAYYHLGRYADAIAAYQQAIALDPEFAYPHSGLGDVYDTLGRYDDAIAAYQQAIALDPKEADHHYDLGNVYYHLDRYDDAVAAYQQAIVLNSKFVAPHSGLGDVSDTLGRYDDAIAAYQQAIALDPKGAYPHNHLGNVYTTLGRYDEAIAAYQQAIALDPKSAYPHNHLGNVYTTLGRYDEAIAAYQQAIALDPKSAYPHNHLGNVYTTLGRYDEAIAAFQQAIVLNSKFAAPHNNLGNVYATLGRYDEAIAAYQQAIALDPKEAAPHNHLGNVYRSTDQYEHAIVALRQAIALDPKDWSSQAALADAYRNLGNEDAYLEAVEIARPLVVGQSDYNHACFASICGEAKEAIALLQSAFAHEPDLRTLALRDPDLDNIRDDPRFQAVMSAA